MFRLYEPWEIENGAFENMRSEYGRCEIVCCEQCARKATDRDFDDDGFRCPKCRATVLELRFASGAKVVVRDPNALFSRALFHTVRVDPALPVAANHPDLVLLLTRDLISRWAMFRTIDRIGLLASPERGEIFDQIADV